jgi:drug/metabolite transporter (DMT)-like permease
VDRILEKGKGKTMFFLTGLAKLLVFAVMFFAASRFAGAGVVFFIQGLLMIYVGVVGAGLRQRASGGGHGA